MQLDGIHHISAITGDARRNLDFYTGTLGLRLIAKTVNQDDPSVYHLFYGDELARAGADLTFFEYPHAVPGRPGAGMVHTIVSRVSSPDALDFWAKRLTAKGVEHERLSATELAFRDPEGLRHVLRATSTDTPLRAEHPEIPAEFALGGFDGVRAYSAHPSGSASLLTKLMGATEVEPGTFEVRGEVRGGTIAFDEPPAERGRQSAGIVHHVAWGTTKAEHPRWLEHLDEHGIHNSGLVDRHYFQSIYFREPGGVLYEIADDAPGFTVDGPVEELGKRIILPPRFEAQRERIEARLTSLPDPRASWEASVS
jgi:glyoxalase family protein